MANEYRIYTGAVEVLFSVPPPDARIYTGAVEVLYSMPPPEARIYTGAVEVLRSIRAVGEGGRRRQPMLGTF